MAHYALLDSNNVVVKVITGVDETETQDDNGTPVGGSGEAWEAFYAAQPWHEGLTCKRTSYNNNIRKQYAGIGMEYLEADEDFRPQQPYPSWTWSNKTWNPPTPMPSTGEMYRWSEEDLEWVAV